MNKVLVVDDEESILKGIRLNLGRSFDITLANGPQEALSIFNEEGPFEVVVSDMRMPGMDGATMLRKIKEENHSLNTELNKKCRFRDRPPNPRIWGAPPGGGGVRTRYSALPVRYSVRYSVRYPVRYPSALPPFLFKS